MKPLWPPRRVPFSAISIPCSLFTTCEHFPSTSNEISIFAGFLRGCSPCSGHSCSASPRSESMPWFPTPSLGERERLAYGSRSGPPSFRTEQADFLFRFRSCECVGLRREKSLFAFTLLTFRTMWETLFSSARASNNRGKHFNTARRYLQ